MTDNQLKKLLNSGVVPVLAAGAFGIVSLGCVALVKCVGQPEIQSISRIVGQLAGYGTLGFSLCGLVGAGKAATPFRIALFSIIGIVLGILSISGTGM